MAHDPRDDPPGHEFRAESRDEVDASPVAEECVDAGSEVVAGEHEDGEHARISLSDGSPFDDLPDDFPDSAGIDLDPDFSSLEASTGTDHDAVPGEERADDDLGSEFSEFADIDNPEMAADLIGETSQDEDPGRWSDHEDEHAVDGIASSGKPVVPRVGDGMGLGRDRAVPGLGLRHRTSRRRTSAGSLAGVVIGGLLSLPLVALILLWGFRRDDFGIARSLPDPLAFLVPAELRLPRLPRAAMPMPPPLPSPPVTLAREEAVTDPILDAAERAALTMAAARAEVMLDAVLDLPVDAPPNILAPALIDWYKSLASVADEATALERDMATQGRDDDAIGPSVRTIASRIAASPRAIEQLTRLTRQWMQSSRRTSDGVFLLGRLQATRQAGSAWISNVTLEGEAVDMAPAESELSGESLQPAAVTVLSRRELGVTDGERVVVLGVLVSEDVVWAAAGMPADAINTDDMARDAAVVEGVDEAGGFDEPVPPDAPRATTE